MYAVIRTGGKQYKVAKDDIIRVERLDAQKGESVTLSDVLALEDGNGLKLGSPLVVGGSVAAEVLEQGRADKVLVFKKRRRQNYRRLKGHRQDYTLLKILGIGEEEKKAKKEAAHKAEKKAPAKKAAAAQEAEASAQKDGE